MSLITFRFVSPLLFVMYISNSYACEPAALNWDQLYQDYDINRNKVIERSEWQQLIQLKNQPYSLGKNADQQDPYYFKIFQQLDTNKDDRLSEEELGGIYRYFPNPCDSWGKTWATDQQESWWEKLLNHFRRFW